MNFSVLLPLLACLAVLAYYRKSVPTWMWVMAGVVGLLGLLLAGYVQTDRGLEFRMAYVWALPGALLVLFRKANPLVVSALGWLSLFITDVAGGLIYAYQQDLGFAWIKALGAGGWTDALVVMPAFSLVGFWILSRLPPLTLTKTA